MANQTIIVYRNPMEEQMWEFWSPIIPYLAGAAVVLIVGYLVVMGVLYMIAKSSKRKRYNSSHYDSAEYNTLADL